MAEIVVRAQEPSDIDDVAAIYNCPGVIAGTLQLPYRSVEFRRERHANPSLGRHNLVASIGGRVVGSLSLHANENPRRRHCGDIGMGVHDDFQGRGVGSKLMEAMRNLADEWLGLRRIELSVYADNAAAIHLYEKFGFRVEGTARQFAFRAGEFVDAHYMARLLP